MIRASTGPTSRSPSRDRSSASSRAPETDEVAKRLSRPPLDYLRRFYADTAIFGRAIALRAALEFFGTENVLFGSDFGFSPDFARARSTTSSR
jgi:hypothetical protein